MICPNDRIQMVNYSKVGNEINPLPNGGISENDVYETWYVYECPKCKRRVKEAYRCEVLTE